MMIICGHRMNNESVQTESQEREREREREMYCSLAGRESERER